MKLKRVLLFPGVSHNIRKPNLKKQLNKKQKLRSNKRETIREKIRNKFDFSKTPYAVLKKPRIPVNENEFEKRKFFKSTVLQSQSQKKCQAEEPLLNLEFNDVNEIDDEPIKKSISKIISDLNWFDDETFKVHVTKQQAENYQNKQVSTLSYITLSNVSPSKVISENADIHDVASNVSSILNNLNVDAKNIQLKNVYFPVFDSSPPTVKRALTDITNKKKNVKSGLIKAAAPNDQYQIDAGQKVIGPKECKKCGMVYDIGDPVDEEHHRNYHINLDNLKYKSLKLKDIVGYCGTDCIVLIKDTDSKWKREKVFSVLKYTENEIGTSNYTTKNYWKALIYVRNENILGCLLAEPNVTAYRVIQDDAILLLSEEKCVVRCGINRIWVKSESRRQHIATELMNCLRKNFIYGDYLQINDIAFSATTPDGHLFAKNYTGHLNYLMY